LASAGQTLDEASQATAAAALEPTSAAGAPFSGEIAGSLAPLSPRTSTGFWTPFRAVPGDFTRLLSSSTLKALAVGGAGAIAAHQWDGAVVAEAGEHLRPGVFEAGNFAGGFLVQAGASFGLYSVARLSGANDLAALGADLTRAHVLSQAIVHAGKFATRRSRPDASDRYSLPSGHTASAFTTAAVLQEHFGWKAGIPAYGFGAYVAASRIAAGKHHLSDVLLGAAVGVAAGRTVTFGLGRTRFNLGVAPTAGGAAITIAAQ
jgi:membrane-associated phospholipid phosphatase